MIASSKQAIRFYKGKTIILDRDHWLIQIVGLYGLVARLGALFYIDFSERE